MSELTLKGLDGANPLGFLAAIGTLRIATVVWPSKRVKMKWVQESGGWRPRVFVDVHELNENLFIEKLNENLKKMCGHPAFSFAKDLSIGCDEFRLRLVESFNTATFENHLFSDFLSAFGSEVVVDKNGIIGDTAFRTMSGAGHQHFIGFMQELAEMTNESHLRSALFETWGYQDDKPSMRWDPCDDRRYALRWGEPSKDPIKTVRGANRLAVEALPLFTTVPVGIRLETTGFTQKKGQRMNWSWPIWDAPASLDVVRSLLSLKELQEESPDSDNLLTMGICEVFRCQRISQGKYRNFTPAVPV